MLLAESLKYPSPLAHAHEGTLALREPHNDGYAQFAGRFEDCLHTGQVRDVEMADRDFILLCFAQHFAQGFHNVSSGRLSNQPIIPPASGAPDAPSILRLKRCEVRPR